MAGLTYNLDVDVSAVRHVLNLNRQSVLSRVGSLRRTNEEDGVHLTGANPYTSVLQENIILEPGHHRTRLSLPGGKQLQLV